MNQPPALLLRCERRVTDAPETCCWADDLMRRAYGWRGAVGDADRIRVTRCVRCDVLTCRDVMMIHQMISYRQRGTACKRTYRRVSRFQARATGPRRHGPYSTG